MKKESFRVFVALSVVAFFVLSVVFGLALIRAVDGIRFNAQYPMGTYVHHLGGQLAAGFASLQERDNVFIEADAAFASLDPESLLGELVVTAVPREYRDGATAQLSIQGQSLPMQWNGDALEARIALPLDTQFWEYRITLKSDGLNRSERIETYVYPLPGGPEVFGSPEYGTGMSWGYLPNLYPVELDLKFDESVMPFGDTARSIRIFAEENGVEIFSEAMQGGAFSMRREFQFEDGVPIVFYAEAEGESGLTYRWFLQSAQRRGNEFHIDGWPENEPYLRIANEQGEVVELTK